MKMKPADSFLYPVVILLPVVYSYQLVLSLIKPVR